MFILLLSHMFVQTTRNVESFEASGNLTSADWLARHSVECEELTINDLMKHGILIRFV